MEKKYLIKIIYEKSLTKNKSFTNRNITKIKCRLSLVLNNVCIIICDVYINILFQHLSCG